MAQRKLGIFVTVAICALMVESCQATRSFTDESGLIQKLVQVEEQLKIISEEFEEFKRWRAEIHVSDGEDWLRSPTTGPPGPPGPKGDKGKEAVGIQGPRGLEGAPGTKGDKGERGTKGDQGEKEILGLKGDRGEPGWPGNPGVKGDNGRDGHPGTKGDKGGRGQNGSQGPQGPKGDKGFHGSRGHQGPKGDKGSSGSTGNQGPKGSNAECLRYDSYIKLFNGKSKKPLETGSSLHWAYTADGTLETTQDWKIRTTRQTSYE